MNCEGVCAVLAKGFSQTTRGERNAACVHCRGCVACQSMLGEAIGNMPPPTLGDVLGAAALLAQDRSDPEWK